ncbi:MAG: hypothetical protein ACPG8W_09815 [Candidatus Promineifilaceae bacterium]
MPTTTPTLHKFALVATLYGDPATLRRFAGDLVASNTWSPETVGNAWRSPDGTLWGVLIARATLVDSAALQLTCNVSAIAGWKAARARLESLLSPARLQDNIGGYTLLYWAECVSVCTDVSPMLSDVSADAIPLHHTGGRACPLHREAAKVGEAGWLWLTHRPIHNNAAEAALVYVAIAQHAHEDALAYQLLGPTAPFLMIDLVTHKGYLWQRQYRLDYDPKQIDSRLSQLADKTSHLLQQDASQSSNELADDTVPRSNTDLEPMTKQYNAVVELLPKLDDIRYNLDKQRVNLKQWATHLPLDPILALHHNQFDITIMELELLLKRGRDKLDVASTAVDIVQTRLDEAQLTQDRNHDLLLALLGTALAVPGVFDRTITAMLLACFDPNVAGCFSSTEQNIASYDYSAFTLMSMQLGIVILATLFVWLMLRFIRRR